MLLCPWDFPGKGTGVGCHFLLQRIFPTQGSNPCLPHCKQDVFLSEPTGKSFHAKMGSIKDRNGVDLTETEDIKTAQKNYAKNIFMAQDNQDGVITHLEPDILECKVKWALGSIL